MVNDKIQSLFRTSLVLLTALGSLVACGSDVVVGDPEEGGEDGDCPGCAEEVVPSSANPCALADEAQLETYNAWRTAPNDLGAIRDTQWEGTVAGSGSARLTISHNQVASLLVGEPFGEAEADKAYPIGSDGSVGFATLAGEYPIHGATLEEGELRLTLESTSPYDAWCALQTPAKWGECRFRVLPLLGNSRGDDGICKLDAADPLLPPSTVDCDWLSMVYSDGYCECTSEQCFARVEPGVQIALNYDKSAGTLEGFTANGSAVLLERVD